MFSNGEKSARSFSGFGSLSAKKVTLEWKIIFRFFGNYNENVFRYPGTRLTSLSRSHGISSSIIKSLSEHWSFGFFTSYLSSSYKNLRQRFGGSPAVEFNFFPYSESTHHSFTVAYELKPQYVVYVEETIFNKTREWLWQHALTVGVAFRQPWGRLSVSVEASQYLHDFSKNRLIIFSGLSWRIFKGLSVNLFGQYSQIHDQLSLPKAGASPEEVLLRRKELATTYSYFVSFGISYSFGSLFTNVVNTRFESRSGGNYSISIVM